MIERAAVVRLFLFEVTALAVLFSPLQVGGVGAADRSAEATYQRLLRTPICDMTDDEYRLFYERHEEQVEDAACTDWHIHELLAKPVVEMNDNEFRYFSEHVFDCDELHPCSIGHASNLPTADTAVMTSNELEFYEDCREECLDWIRTHPRSAVSTAKELHWVRPIPRLVYSLYPVVVPLLYEILFLTATDTEDRPRAHDVPNLDDPVVPPVWRIRQDIAGYAYLSHDDISPSPDVQEYVQLQEIFGAYTLSVGFPGRTALLLRACGLGFGFGAKWAFLDTRWAAAAVRAMALTNKAGPGVLAGVSLSSRHALPRSELRVLANASLKRAWGHYYLPPMPLDSAEQTYHFVEPPRGDIQSLNLEIPLGLEVVFRNCAVAVYGAYVGFIKSYSVRASDPDIVSYKPGPHFVVGVQTSIWRYEEHKQRLGHARRRQGHTPVGTSMMQ